MGLSEDLQREFSGMAGFSPQNIWFMRSFYLAWTEEVRRQLAEGRSASSSNLSQLVRDLDGKDPPQPVAEIPWGHNRILLTKVKDPAVRLWYAQMTLQHGWSRNILELQIGNDLHGRQGKAVTNFKRTLPAPQSDLAQQALKDPYVFDFLTLQADALERELEKGLRQHYHTRMVYVSRRTNGLRCLRGLVYAKASDVFAGIVKPTERLNAVLVGIYTVFFTSRSSCFRLASSFCLLIFCSCFLFLSFLPVSPMPPPFPMTFQLAIIRGSSVCPLGSSSPTSHQSHNPDR